MKLTDLFLSAGELRKLTGSTAPAEQVRFLRSQGLNPWVHPQTGCPVLYRDVVLRNQMSDDREGGFEMNLEGING